MCCAWCGMRAVAASCPAPSLALVSATDLRGASAPGMLEQVPAGSGSPSLETRRGAVEQHQRHRDSDRGTAPAMIGCSTEHL